MFEVGGLKVGVIGLLTVNTPSTTATDLQGLQILEYNKITITESNNLRKNGADLVILQCHVGMFCDDNETYISSH
jgi:2',3'-cyclic-nucleotide 2'-phosphodiesterase (5'-nucleotidase family)